ncbi:MAG: S8 family serine peptidase [Euzebyales bacterium]|nr:S8 family serine peptidase [Euzebyales bacterium]
MRRLLLILCALALAIPVGAAAAQETAPDGPDRPLAERLSQPRTVSDGRALSPALEGAQGTVRVAIELAEPPTAQVQREASDAAAQDAEVQQQVDRIDAQQAAFLRRNAAVLDQPAQDKSGAATFPRMRVALNAVLAEVDAADLAGIAADPDVVRVSPLPDYERGPRVNLEETVPYINTGDPEGPRTDPTAGTGVVVAVLDSGIDYTHASLGGPGTDEAYDEAYGADGAGNPDRTSSNNRTAPSEGLYDTTKFQPGDEFGYDFVGEFWPVDGPERFDPNPIDAPTDNSVSPPLSGGHGTHVADIIAGVPAPAASPDPSPGGVAPGAQLMGIRVCSSLTPNCSGLALALGIEYALDPDGDGIAGSNAADIINMSLGATYGSPFDDATSQAVENASSLGTLTVASAGNSSDRPFITGTPSSTPSALSVAQTAVPSAMQDVLTINEPSSAAGNYEAVFQPWSANPPAEGLEGEISYGDGAGGNTLGCDPFPAGSLTGKVLLVDRGACNFTLKAANGEDAGAIMTIIGLVTPEDPFTGGDGGDRPEDGTFDTPSYMIGQDDNTTIKDAIAAGETVVGGVDPAEALPLIGTVVGSSSRGPSNVQHDLKPEIGAPGASVSAISGTGDDAERGAFGGTSGAAPMVAGSAAVLLENTNFTPAELKARLMNTADRDIRVGAEDPQTGAPAPLAPITRIGAGEVRIEPALGSPASASVADDPRRGAALSFGFPDVSQDLTATRTVRVQNYEGAAVTYAVDTDFRFSDYEASGVTLTPEVTEIVVPAGEAVEFDVELSIDASALRRWTLDSGFQGANGDLLTELEVGGHVALTNQTNADNVLLMPWHVLPRQAGEVTPGSDEIAFTGGEGSVELANAGEGQANVNSYTLLGTSPRLGETSVPGASAPVIDLAAAGVNTFEVPFCDAGVLFEFAVQTHDRITHANAPASLEVQGDIDGDGEADFVVFTAELGLVSGLGFAADGRNVVVGLDLNTGAGSIFFFTDHPMNSGNTVLTVCGEQIGLSDADLGSAEVSIDVLAVDSYYQGVVTDTMDDLPWTPGAERYTGEDLDVPADSTATLTATDAGDGAGEGLLIFNTSVRADGRSGAADGTEAYALIAVEGEPGEPTPGPTPTDPPTDPPTEPPVDPPVEPPIDPPVEPATVTRLSGPGRIETAIAISQDSFGDGEANTVVLARADDYPDALAGTPLAVTANGPLLITSSNDLVDIVADEIARVLPAGGTVHVLGGQAALDATVQAQLTDLGYQVARIFGATRFETAVAIADFLGDPDQLLITTGVDYPDALAAGTAAAVNTGAVLLTAGDQPHPAVDAYLAEHGGADTYGVGGPAARAYPDATPVFGTTRDGTAVAVAEEFFDAPPVAGFARRDAFPDSLAGGAHSGRLGGPLLLTYTDTLSVESERWTCDNADGITHAYAYGGTAAISQVVVDAIAERVNGEGCG